MQLGYTCWELLGTLSCDGFCHLERSTRAEATTSTSTTTLTSTSTVTTTTTLTTTGAVDGVPQSRGDPHKWLVSFFLSLTLAPHQEGSPQKAHKNAWMAPSFHTDFGREAT